MNQENIQTCGAKTKGGHFCKNSPMRTSNRCRLHGGKSLKGVEHPNFKHGGYTRFVPKSLMPNYQFSANKSDETLFSMRHDLLLLDAQIDSLFEQYDNSTQKEQKTIRVEIRNLLKVRANLVKTDLKRLQLYSLNVPIPIVKVMLQTIMTTVAESLRQHPELQKLVLSRLQNKITIFTGGKPLPEDPKH